MTAGLPLVLGPAVGRGTPREQAPIGHGVLLGPFTAQPVPRAHSAPDTIAAPAAPTPPSTVAESMGEIAGRLERIAGSLRNTSPDGLLAAGADGQDTLALLITAFALGYHEGRMRAPAVDPPVGSS